MGVLPEARDRHEARAAVERKRLDLPRAGLEEQTPHAELPGIVLKGGQYGSGEAAAARRGDHIHALDLRDTRIDAADGAAGHGLSLIHI